MNHSKKSDKTMQQNSSLFSSKVGDCSQMRQDVLKIVATLYYLNGWFGSILFFTNEEGSVQCRLYVGKAVRFATVHFSAFCRVPRLK